MVKIKNIPDVVKKIHLGDLLRIDVALEGNWSPTVATVWTRDNGFIDFLKVKKSHKVFKPSIELYFEDFWIGIHCFERIGNKNIFDEKLAMNIIDFIDKTLKKK